jgi:hypothetical protein
VIEIGLLIVIYVAAHAVAVRRGRKGPIVGFIAVLAYLGGAFFGPSVISALTGLTLEQTEVEPVLWNLWRDVYYRTAILCALGAAALVLAFVYVLPNKKYEGTRPRTRIPYAILAVLTVIAGLAVLFMSRGRLLYSVWGFALLWVGKYFFDISRRQRSKPAEATLSSDPRPPILLLQSFHGEPPHVLTDANFFTTLWAGDLITLEEAMKTEVQKQLGPFIGFGKPDDYVPTAGAAKIYRNHDTWQAAFSELVARAQAIFVFEGAGDGLAWELLQIRKTVRPEIVFLLTGPYRRTVAWSETRRLLANAELSVLEADPGHGAVLTFDEHWTASILATGAKTGVGYVSVICERLQAIGLRSSQQLLPAA